MLASRVSGILSAVGAAACALGLTAATACGPSAAEIRTARRASYDTAFARVWNVTVAIVSKDYAAGFKVEDATRGYLLTHWHMIQKDDQSDEAAPSMVGNDPPPKTAGSGMGPLQIAARAGILLQISVRIKGGPPWRVIVEGEAGRYDPDLTLLIPYQRGAPDEPPWVQKRIDNLQVKIYRRLRKFAKVAPPDPSELPPKPPSTEKWAQLPAAAARVIAQVEAHASKRNTAALKHLMSDPFASVLGSTPPDATLAVWSADATTLTQLAATLKAECRLADAHTVRCTDASGSATFVVDDDEWKFSGWEPNP